MNVEGQLLSVSAAQTNIELLLLSVANDTIWHEQHTDVPLTSNKTFSIAFGNGTRINGLADTFDSINWLEGDHLELYYFDADVRYLQGDFKMYSVPFAQHSLRLLEIPATHELSDFEVGLALDEQLFEFNEGVYILGIDDFADTLLYSDFSPVSYYSDTATFAYPVNFSDSALYAYFADTNGFALSLTSVNFADSVFYSDTAAVAFESLFNWSLSGNALNEEPALVGTLNDIGFRLRTNNQNRLQFGDLNEVNNGLINPGFSLYTPRGVLFEPTVAPGVGELSGSHLYFDGETKAFHGGTYTGEIDSLQGLYSFAWGENVGTNGTYGTVFGKNTYGDSTLNGGTMYSAVSGFALGKDCRVSRTGVAIGENATANYYRNVAIGKNVTSTNASSGVAMGNNVNVSGAVSWAVGHNLTADGNFCTLMGYNASVNGHIGSFVYGDFSTSDTVFSTANGQFMTRSAGGYVFYSDPNATMGVTLAPGGGSWSMISDQRKKRDLILLSPLNYQTQFLALPVSQWTYKNQRVAHIGPMAQDMYSIFSVGEKPTAINMIDSDGITFLGIKMLNSMLLEVEEKLAINKAKTLLEKEKEAQSEMEERIKEIYEKLDRN